MTWPRLFRVIQSRYVGVLTWPAPFIALQGLCMSFMSQVARDHHSVVTALCQKHLKLASDALKAPLLQPTGARHTQVEGYWLPVGGEEQRVSDKYILTQSVRDNLRNLARIISARLLE